MPCPWKEKARQKNREKKIKGKRQGNKYSEALKHG